MNETLRVVLFQVTDPQAKITRLVQTVDAHFLKREKMVIIAEDDKALGFVDELLWKHSPELFLPHAIVDAECQDIIAITKLKKNINGAHIAFNLCPTPLLIEGFRLIYDFEDVSSPSKKLLSSTRLDGYKTNHYLIESRIA